MDMISNIGTDTNRYLKVRMDMTIRQEKEFLKRIKAAQLLNIFVQE